MEPIIGIPINEHKNKMNSDNNPNKKHNPNILPLSHQSQNNLDLGQFRSVRGDIQIIYRKIDDLKYKKLEIPTRQ